MQARRIRPLWLRLSPLPLVLALAVSPLGGCGGRTGEGEAESGTGGSIAGSAAVSGGKPGTHTGGKSSGGATSAGASSVAGGGNAPSCNDLSRDYDRALQNALPCSPQLNIEQCTQTVGMSLHCGCPMLANPANTSALMQMERLRAEYDSQQCGSDVICGPCYPSPRAYCSAEGSCVNVFAQ